MPLYTLKLGPIGACAEGDLGTAFSNEEVATNLQCIVVRRTGQLWCLGLPCNLIGQPYTLPATAYCSFVPCIPK